MVDNLRSAQMRRQRPRTAPIIRKRGRAGGFKAAGDAVGSMNTSGKRWVTHSMVNHVNHHKNRMTLNGINTKAGFLRF